LGRGRRQADQGWPRRAWWRGRPQSGRLGWLSRSLGARDPGQR
jgi:hypothetical protein